MKKIFLLLIISYFSSCAFAENKDSKIMKKNHTTIQLNSPNLDRGESIMQALKKRKATKEFSTKELSNEDLSDLLWAANGINRKESGKRTAPSAMNRQDVKVYVCLKNGSYLYNSQNETLDFISKGDVRPTEAAVVLVLVTDTDDTWAAIDAGIVSQNISLFCSGNHIADYPRASMDRDILRAAFKLSQNQTIMLCHPIGYF